MVIGSFFIGIGNIFKTLWEYVKGVGRLCLVLFKIIISPFKLFILYFQAVKNDHCPGITWEHESNVV